MWLGSAWHFKGFCRVYVRKDYRRPGNWSSIGFSNENDKIPFTGSTSTAPKIQEASAKNDLKRVSIELGGEEFRYRVR
jgi:hypothetical protein